MEKGNRVKDPLLTAGSANARSLGHVAGSVEASGVNGISKQSGTETMYASSDSENSVGAVVFDPNDTSLSQKLKEAVAVGTASAATVYAVAPVLAHQLVPIVMSANGVIVQGLGTLHAPGGITALVQSISMAGVGAQVIIVVGVTAGVVYVTPYVYKDLKQNGPTYIKKLKNITHVAVDQLKKGPNPVDYMRHIGLPVLVNIKSKL